MSPRPRHHDGLPAKPRKPGMVKWKIVHNASCFYGKGRAVTMKLLRKHVSNQCVGAKAGKPVWEMRPYGKPQVMGTITFFVYPDGHVDLRMFGAEMSAAASPEHVMLMAKWAYQAAARRAGHRDPQDRQNGWAAARVFADLYRKAKEPKP